MSDGNLEERVRRLEIKAAEAEGGKRAVSSMIEPIRKWVAPALLTLLSGWLGWEAFFATKAPVGSIVAWPTDAEPPPGWMICRGGSAPFSEGLWRCLAGLYGNPKLDDVVGAPEVIKLPDFQGYFLRGQGGQGAHLSDAIGKAQPQAVQQHEHDIPFVEVGGNAVRPSLVPGHYGEGPITSSRPTGAPDFQNTASSTKVGYFGPETRPVNYAVHWIIRVN